MLREILPKYKENWYIYGSGIVAYNIAEAIRTVYDLKPKAYIVTEYNSNERFIDKTNIITIESIDNIVKHDALILLATPEVYHNQIREELDKRGYKNCIAVDSHAEYLIMSEYYRQTGTLKCTNVAVYESKPDTSLDISDSLKIYMAKSAYDKELTKKYDIPEYIHPVYAGAALGKGEISAKLRDDDGLSISTKNRNYCELTVTYWAWKNTRSTYKGICHYRRMIILNEEHNQMIKNESTDVILSLPFVCEKDISQQYERYVKSDDLEGMLNAIKDVYPQDYEKAKDILKGRYIYNYNMVIAKEAIYNDYCRWMFAILDRAEHYCDPEGIRQDRYAGYLGELLTTIYFIKNRDNLNVWHGERIWMV